MLHYKVGGRGEERMQNIIPAFLAQRHEESNTQHRPGQARDLSSAQDDLLITLVSLSHQNVPDIP